MQYYVLRRAGTERPHSHPLHAERRPGRYLCAGCDAPLFSAAAKLDYGTGWPSFSVALSGAVRIGSDDALGYPRHEVRCAHCDGHLGHRLTDASTPSGRRYSMNGAGLRFVPTKAAG
jgi:peptide-methionine (R)-S-oxide reductase